MNIGHKNVLWYTKYSRKQALLEAQEKKNLFLDSQGKMMFQVPLYSFCTAESNYLQKNSL